MTCSRDGAGQEVRETEFSARRLLKDQENEDHSSDAQCEETEPQTQKREEKERAGRAGRAEGEGEEREGAEEKGNFQPRLLVNQKRKRKRRKEREGWKGRAGRR